MGAKKTLKLILKILFRTKIDLCGHCTDVAEINLQLRS